MSSLNSSPSNQPINQADPIGNWLVNQPLAAGPSRQAEGGAAASEADAATVSRLLDPAAMGDDDDLLFELMYLETLLAGEPAGAHEVLGQLGELGDELRRELPPAGAFDIVAIRERARRLKPMPSETASRVTAAVLLAVTTLPALGGAAHAATTPDSGTFQIAAAPVVRVVDANSGQGIAGVQIKSMEEQLLGVTDATGQATLSEGYMDTDLLSLEKEGYQMYLLDRSQLSSRNIVSMKPITKTAANPKTKSPTAPKLAEVPTPRPVATPKAPASPVVKLPNRPKNPKVAATLAPRPTPTPVAIAVRPSPMATPRPKVQIVPLVLAPHLESPIKHPARQAAVPHATPTPEIMHQPVAPRRVAQAKPTAAPHATAIAEAPTVAVPKRMPAHRDGRDGAATHYYRVRPGDTLSGIALRELGNANRWHELYQANRHHIANPSLIHVGQRLAVPAASAARAHHRHYTVRPGDSLFTIAQRELGDGNRWHELFAANRRHVANPRLIFPGERLTLPE